MIETVTEFLVALKYFLFNIIPGLHRFLLLGEEHLLRSLTRTPTKGRRRKPDTGLLPMGSTDPSAPSPALLLALSAVENPQSKVSLHFCYIPPDLGYSYFMNSMKLVIPLHFIL